VTRANGHYYTHAKNEGKWVKFDDSRFGPSSHEDATRFCITPSKNMGPYMLFYRLMAVTEKKPKEKLAPSSTKATSSSSSITTSKNPAFQKTGNTTSIVERRTFKDTLMGCPSGAGDLRGKKLENTVTGPSSAGSIKSAKPKEPVALPNSILKQKRSDSWVKVQHKKKRSDKALGPSTQGNARERSRSRSPRGPGVREIVAKFEMLINTVGGSSAVGNNNISKEPKEPVSLPRSSLKRKRNDTVFGGAKAAEKNSNLKIQKTGSAVVEEDGGSVSASGAKAQHKKTRGDKARGPNTRGTTSATAPKSAATAEPTTTTATTAAASTTWTTASPTTEAATTMTSSSTTSYTPTTEAETTTTSTTPRKQPGRNRSRSARRSGVRELVPQFDKLKDTVRAPSLEKQRAQRRKARIAVTDESSCAEVYITHQICNLDLNDRIRTNY